MSLYSPRRARRRSRSWSARRPFLLEVLEDRTCPSLVLALGFDETSGATAADASGGGNGGPLSGGVSRSASGKYGGALSFDGVNGMVSVADANSLDLTAGMTLEAWVKPAAVSGWQTVALKERAN